MEEGQVGIGEELLVEMVDMSKIVLSRETLERWYEELCNSNIPVLSVITELKDLLK